MTIPAILALPVMVGFTAYTAWVVFVGIPSNLTSLFRHKMWRIRDQIMDEAIRDGNLESRAAEVAAAEGLIAVAKFLTLARAITIFVLPLLAALFRNRREILKGCAQPESSKKAELPPGAMLKVVKALVKRLLTSSLSGWLCLMFLLPIYLMSKLGGRVGTWLRQLFSCVYGFAGTMLNQIRGMRPANTDALLVG